jgi:hypothetical protein
LELASAASLPGAIAGLDGDGGEKFLWQNLFLPLFDKGGKGGFQSICEVIRL